MTNSKFLRVGSAVALALVAYGCDNDRLTALNENPNSPEDVPAGPLFTNAARVGVARWFGAYDLRTAEFVVQHHAEIAYNDEDRYVRIHAADTELDFTNSYSNELKDLQRIINKGEADGEPGTYAPAYALRTWGFSYITNNWGDVPYFSALAGDGADASLAPVYDDQQAIYADFFAVLDKAADDLVGASNTLGAADPVYAGNTLKWQKFINSLRARLAMLVVNVDPALASAQLAAAISGPGGLILTNADNAKISWPGDGVYNNPWSIQLGARDDYRMSNRFMNLMASLNDPRIQIFAQPTVADPTVYAGSPNSILPTKATPYFNTTSRPGTIFFAGKTTYGPTFGGSGQMLPTWFLTAAEVNFILAEAAERSLGGLTPGQAAGYYNTAITQSMMQWSEFAAPANQITAAEIAAYLAQPGVAYQGGVAGQIQIAEQKWIALYTDGGTAWAEWRRTCRPATIVPGVDATETTVPRRLEYSVRENSVNEAAVQDAIANQGPDTFHSRMWWDTAPQVAPTYPGPACGTQNGT